MTRLVVHDATGGQYKPLAQALPSGLPGPSLTVGTPGQSTCSVTWGAPASGPTPTGIGYGWFAPGGLPVPRYDATTTLLTGTVVMQNLAADSFYDMYAEALYGTNVGSRTTVRIRTAPATAPAPAPPSSDGSALPTKIVGAWFFGFNGPTMDQILDLSASRRPNYMCAAVAQSSGAGTGNIAFAQAGSRVTAASVARAKNMGIPVTLLIGGGGDGGIALTSSTHAQQMIASIKSSVTQFGWSGIDWDIESDSWTQAAAIEVSRALRAHYGPSFIIAYAPQPYRIRDSASKEYGFIRQSVAEGLIDFVTPQFYDNIFWNNPDNLRNQIASDLSALRGTGLPGSKMVLGAITQPTYTINGATGSAAPQSYINAYNNALPANPGLRGYMIWETFLESQAPWDYGGLRAFNSAHRGVV